MFIRATKSQIIFLLKQKSALFTCSILLLLVLVNYLSNVFAFCGRDVLQMYQPMKLLLISYNRVNYNASMTLLLIQLYPLLVVCPAGFSLAMEYQSGEETLMIVRAGSFYYKMSKLLASFVVTFIIFAGPFFLEIILNCISFPLTAIGDLTNWSTYSVDYLQSVGKYQFSNIYLISPYLYAFFGTIMFSFISGICGAFTVAFSSIVRVKYRVFLFVPMFLLLNASIYFPSAVRGISTRWFDYLLIFNDEPKSFVYFSSCLLAMIVSSCFVTYLSARRDCIQ